MSKSVEATALEEALDNWLGQNKRWSPGEAWGLFYKGTQIGKVFTTKASASAWITTNIYPHSDYWTEDKEFKAIIKKHCGQDLSVKELNKARKELFEAGILEVKELK